MYTVCEFKALAKYIVLCTSDRLENLYSPSICRDKMRDYNKSIIQCPNTSNDGWAQGAVYCGVSKISTKFEGIIMKNVVWMGNIINFTSLLQPVKRGKDIWIKVPKEL